MSGVVPAQAQFSRDGIFDYRWDVSPPIELITTIDIQKALIWAGHYNGMADGSFGKQSRAAAIAWQEAHKFPATGSLAQDQIVQLFNEGMRSRDAAKWTLLVDRGAGVVIPYPAALTNFKSVQPTENGLQYVFEGTVNITVMLGRPVTCANLDALYNKEIESAGPERQIVYQARRDNWYVVSGIYGARRFYTRAECRSSGTAIFAINVPGNDERLVTVLFAAFSNGVSVAPALRLNAKPDLATQAPELGSVVLDASSHPGARVIGTQRAAIDPSGKTIGAKLALASGAELRPQDVFDRARGAVYVVKPDDTTQGSAVAISATDLLTNCHVIGDAWVVAIVRDEQTLTAEVISRDKGADRCVLRSTVTLPSWVTIGAYADVKVGERAYTIGAPLGLELTLAEGLVSSKRLIVLNRFVQTSAPISPGSSGGGLFDA
ncbi:MAG: serine protease [Rhodospirillales bacterium]